MPKSPGFGPKGFTGCVGSGGNTGPLAKPILPPSAASTVGILSCILSPLIFYFY